MASVYKTFVDGKIDDRTLTIAGAIGSFINGSSRIFWATLQDHYGFKNIYIIMLVIQFFTSIFIFVFQDNKYLYSLLICLAFLVEGGHFSTFPACAVKIFGIAEGGKIFTISFFAVPLSSLVGFALAENTKYISVVSIFIVSAVLTFINIILLIFFDETEIKVI